MKAQRGFTLIELVVVIVILGILAATALPRFVDLSNDAGNAAAQAVEGAVSSSSAMNYAKGRAGGGTTYSVTVANNTACTTLFGGPPNGLLAVGYDSTKYTVTGTVGNCGGAGNMDTTSCAIKYSATGATTYSATLTCTG